MLEEKIVTANFVEITCVRVAGFVTLLVKVATLMTLYLILEKFNVTELF